MRPRGKIAVHVGQHNGCAALGEHPCRCQPHAFGRARDQSYRTILGRITKRGNRYLRMLFMQAARVVLVWPSKWMKHSFGPWLAAAAQRLHHNVLATALANKLARIAWSVLAQDRTYEARVSAGAA